MEEDIDVTETFDPRQFAIEKYSRDEHGLLKNVDYVFNDDGSVNWRSMVKPEFLYVNKEYFEKWGKEVPSSLEGLKDKQLSILLGGIKDVAKIRGYRSVSYDISGDKKHVVSRCRINFIPNYETNFEEVVFEDFANASVDNTDDFCHKFLETISCNRSFVRCVRNFLNINIVGDDEIDKSGKSLSVDSSENPEESSMISPYKILEDLAKEKGINNFEAFVAWLREQWKSGVYKNQDAKIWTAYKDIPLKECRKLLGIFQKIT